MMQLILFLVLGAGLLLLVLAAITRPISGPAEGSSQTILDARQALNALQRNLLPEDLIARIFAKPDLEYVLRSTSEPVQQLFVEERRKVALVWVRQVRKGLVTLRAFHRGQARHYSRLSLRTEMNLALSFAVLLLACRTLEVALYLRGPYVAPRIVGRTAGVAARLCQVSEKSLAFLNAEALSALSGSSTREGVEV